MYDVQRRTSHGEWETVSTFRREDNAWTFVIDKLIRMRRRRVSIFREAHERVTVVDNALMSCTAIRAGEQAPELIDVMGVQFRVIGD